MMDHHLALEAMFLADDLGMNRGDFAFIIFRINAEDIQLTVRYPKYISPFTPRFSTTKLTVGAAKSLRNALMISYVIDKRNLLSDRDVLKIVSNLTQAPPFKSSKKDANKYPVSRRR